MKDKPTKPNGTLSCDGESWPVYWDLVDDSMYWCDFQTKSPLKMGEWKEMGFKFTPLPSEAVKEVKPQGNTPFKWPDYWVYSVDDQGLESTPEWGEFVAVANADVSDNVKHPNHYNQDGQIECIDAIKASLGLEGFAAYCKGNVEKYLWRYKYKGGIEDLNKAQQYLTWLIETEEEIQKCSSQQ